MTLKEYSWYSFYSNLQSPWDPSYLIYPYSFQIHSARISRNRSF